MQPPKLPLHELELLKRWINHRSFVRTLQDLQLTTDLALLATYVESITRAWFELGDEHLTETRAALAANLARATFSKAYYAVYNQSKAVRFYMAGAVSLKGDDHQKAGSLPGDFPDVASWAVRIGVLYQHRLRADYDNWADTTSAHTLLPAQCVAEAEQFRAAASAYLAGQGLKL